MLCQSCHTFARGSLCDRCRAQLRPAPERILDGGIRLVAAFEHVGVAREMVHSLKYRGLTSFVDLVVETVADRVPRLPIVPVPRTWSRQIRYGIDPAREIGLRLARSLDVPLLDQLSAPLHARRRAGGDHNRPAPDLRARTIGLGRIVLVDDVVTTGATIRSAARTLGSERIALVIAANLTDTVSSPRRLKPGEHMKIRQFEPRGRP
jgi:predicted amidophosphoribosyltransferase